LLKEILSYVSPFGFILAQELKVDIKKKQMGGKHTTYYKQKENQTQNIRTLDIIYLLACLLAGLLAGLFAG